MTFSTSPIIWVTMLAVATVTSAACSRTGSGAPERGSRATDSTAAPSASVLAPVTLPDLSRVAPSVKEQMEQAYAGLTASTGRAGTPSADVATAYGEMGKLFLATEFGQAAELCFQHAASLAPADRRWPYYLGHVYKARGETAKSTAAFERARELGPDDLPTLVWLGESYLAEDRLDSASSAFDRARALDASSASAMLGQGRVALARRSYVEAARQLEEALKQQRTGGEIHYALALAYRGLGEAAKAEGHMAQRGAGSLAVQDPLMDEVRRLLTSTNTYESRGIAALEAGDHHAAAAQFRKGLELAPDDAPLHHRLGTALVLSGDVDGGRRAFEKAVQLAPDLARAHYSLAVLLASTGQIRQAADRLTTAVRHDPSYVEARLLLGDISRHMGRSKDALQQYEAVMNLDPRVAEAQLGHALALADLGQFAKAADGLLQASQTHPDRADVMQALARVRAAAPDAAVRNGAEALAIVQRLVGRGPAGPDVAEAAAMAHAEVGDYEQAVTWQRQAMEAAQRAGRGDDVLREMRVNLDLFQRGQPCRTPWADYAVP